jgi:hypothetical protein
MISNSTIRQYLSAGKRLTLLSGKRPIVENWTKKAVDEDRIFSHSGNLGWVIGNGDLVIDVDPRNGGDKSFNQLKQDLKLNGELTPTVFTPSGGFHIYLNVGEKDKAFKKTVKQYPGIDFLTQGSQCVIVGSTTEVGSYTWSEDLFGEFLQSEAPKDLINILDKGKQKGLATHEDLGDFEGLIGNEGMEEYKVLDILDKLDPSVLNDEWVKIGMALHHWHPAKGLDLWENWSKGGNNYQEGETVKRWESFSNTAGGVTLGTVVHMAKEVDYDTERTEVESVLAQIKVGDEKNIEFDLIPAIRKTIFSRFNKEKLVKALQSRLKELTGVSMPIGNIRGLVAKETWDEDGSGQLVDETEKPKWCEGWIYVNSHTGYMNLKTCGIHKSESFNLENGKFVPVSDSGTKPSASKYVSDHGFVDKVDAIAYLPGVDDSIVELEGRTLFNVFNPKTLPLEAPKFTKEGKDAVETVKKHVKFICSNDADTDIFLQWLAFQVQYPGKRILWSPVIQSIQGVGKSFFGELLRACLGDRNVGTVSPTQVTSDFNGWATNVCVNVLEELRVKGHNRYEATNALKPLITDRMIQINEKGVKPYMTYNTANYMCFTNYKDALPLDMDDRRWWVIFAPIQSLDEMPKYVGMSAGEYFSRLFRAIEDYGSELRKWFLEYHISSDFKRIKQAPMTHHKELMIATEDAGMDGLLEIKELIKEGDLGKHKFVCSSVISQSDLNDLILFEHPELDLTKGNIRTIMKKLNYDLNPKLVKIEGRSLRIWMRHSMSNDDIREAFATLEDL